VIQSEDDTFVRLTTDDAELLLPALLARGASFWLGSRGRVDVRGMGVAEVARIAAFHNASVIDLETVPLAG
jgi:hypothetical protein